MTQNAANPRAIRSQGRLATKIRARFLMALREVMGTEAGQIVLLEREHGLLARFGEHRSCYSSDALEMAYRSGRQDAAREILALIVEADEQKYLEGEARMRALARKDAGERDAGELAAAVQREGED